MTLWARPIICYKNNRLRWTRGFTIVELLIVIVVIAILAAITIVAFTGIQERARSTATASGAEQAGKKIAVYSVGNSNVLPADQPAFATATGLSNSGDVTYQYSANTAVSPNLFCVTYTSGSTSAHVAGDAQGGTHMPIAGPCPGHTGTSPTALIDGSSCPTNYIVVPGSSLYDTNAFCVMKYEAKNVGGVATSQSSDTPWVSISHNDAVTAAQAACTGCHLITENEWLTIAQNALYVGTNWSGGGVGSGTLFKGHTDNNPSAPMPASQYDSSNYANTNNTSGDQGRTLTLSNGEVIWDFSGNVTEWSDSRTASATQPGPSGWAWREWNNSSVNATGTLSPVPFPGYANLSAVGWSSSQNIGQVYSNGTDTTNRVFVRGGAYSNGANAGMFALQLNLTPTATSGSLGFRVTK